MSDDKQDIVEEVGAAPVEDATEHHSQASTEAGEEASSNEETIQDSAAELSLEATIEQLEADLGEAKEAALRAQADAINVQRRAEAVGNRPDVLPPPLRHVLQVQVAAAQPTNADARRGRQRERLGDALDEAGSSQ